MECDYDQAMMSGMNCIKIGLPGKLILGDYFQEIELPKDLFSYRGDSFG